MLRDRYLFASYCVCVKRITLCNCLCSSSSFSASIIWNIWEFRAKNYFTNHQTANTIHRLEIHFRSLKHTTVVRIRKNLETFHSYASDNKAITVCWCKKPTSNSFQTLQTVYSYSNSTIDQLLYCWEMF